jgi:phosphatidylglycerophosphate synthase
VAELYPKSEMNLNKDNKSQGPMLKLNDVLKAISRDRERTNLLKNGEQRALAYLVQRVPSWINSDMLTAIGFFGNIIVFTGFILATYLSKYYLLLGVLGFAISWVGDSLDGRLAYYRKKPRKWYGFTLDITIDWMSIILIGLGFIVYAEGFFELLGYGFVVLYGWEMIIALIRYRITGNYSIDSGKLSPTEVRIIISVILIMEVLLQGSIIYSASVIVVVLFIVNVIDTNKLLKIADTIDDKERENNKVQNSEK